MKEKLKRLLKDEWINNKLKKRIEEVLSQLEEREKLPLEERKKNPFTCIEKEGVKFYFLGKNFLFAKEPSVLGDLFYFLPIEDIPFSVISYTSENYERCMVVEDEWRLDDDE